MGDLQLELGPYAEQLELEQQQLAHGAARYEETKLAARDRGAASILRPYKRLSRSALPAVTSWLEAWLEENDRHGKGRTHVAVRPLKSLCPEKLAFIGLTACFDSLSRHVEIRKILNLIGKITEEELWISGLQKSDPDAWGRIFPAVKAKHTTAINRMKALRGHARHRGDEIPDTWDQRRRIKVAEPIFNAVMHAAGLFETYRVISGNKKRRDVYMSIQLQEEARDIVTDMEEQARWMRPFAYPMVVPPKPWAGVREGGYLNPVESRRFNLVRDNGMGDYRHIQAAIWSGVLDRCLGALNAVQETPFRINRPVLNLVRTAFEEELGLSKFPSSKRAAPVVFPLDYDQLSSDQQRWWKKQAQAVHQHNRSVDSRAVMFGRDMKRAADMAEKGRFWLPHNLDFRGRVYPIPTFNHQREDHIRALFEFAEAKPLGRTGPFWLAVHLANCGDFDKISKRPLQERVDWVSENISRIVSVGRDPEEDLWWTEADKPFQFYAACREWVGFMEEGEDFLSRLPIALDGSNSGLQHYSALLRAEEDGFHVNLCGGPENQDIYRAVAERVLELVKADLEDPEAAEMARLWLDHGIDRKTVKRSVMTFPYSSETYGFAQQLQEDLMAPLTEKVLAGKLVSHPFGPDEGRHASTYLAKHIWSAVTETVSRAAQGMKFLQGVASALASENKKTTWTTPVGFPVTHFYPEWEAREVELWLYDRTLKVEEASTKDRVDGDDVYRRVKQSVVDRPSDKIKKSKQRSAVAPNVIHSLDAAHLLLTVSKAKAEGISHFFLIHDSFATHAANTSRFFEIIREAFVEMYEEHDPLQDIYDRAYEALSKAGRKRLPTPPPKGDLDLRQVLTSEFSFC